MRHSDVPWPITSISTVLLRSSRKAKTSSAPDEEHEIKDIAINNEVQSDLMGDKRL